jgi:hypothetical protein
MLTIHDIVKDAIEDFWDRLNDDEWTTECDVYDLIHEIADSHVPIYYSQVLEVARSDLWLVTTQPELWPAFWTASPVHFLMTNIYEYLSEELAEWYNANKT